MTAVAEHTVDAHRAPRPAMSRAEQARAALATAEERTGTAHWVRAARSRAAEPGPAATRTQPAPQAGERLLPVRADLAHLLPAGALGRGSTVVVAGSTSLVLALLVEASRAGSWVALVGLPGVGVLAAHQLGLELERVVLVPDPGADGPTVVAALLDGVDLVVVGPQAALGDGDRRRLSARARERSAVLLPTTPWPGAQVVLTARTSHWEGLGRGDGRLRTRRLTVERGGRGMADQVTRTDVVLPAPAPSTIAPVELVPAGRRAG